MATITNCSQRPEPLIDIRFLSHGTLECRDLQATRRFYEEVLGLQLVQYAPGSCWVRLGSDHVYTLLETGRERDAEWFNHNGLDVDSEDAVRVAYDGLIAVKDEYGVRKVQKPRLEHGVFSFYFQDLDGNWWEILANPLSRGYARLFEDPEVDITGLSMDQFLARPPLAMASYAALNA